LTSRSRDVEKHLAEGDHRCVGRSTLLLIDARSKITVTLPEI
jgi:hypothetical protein